ncbi:hypothetical protein PtB15_4B440 [Puccinia triticina]|nr:hypothetical protein PtB15_4B440 [Puccinia triticina]
MRPKLADREPQSSVTLSSDYTAAAREKPKFMSIEPEGTGKTVAGCLSLEKYHGENPQHVPQVTEDQGLNLDHLGASQERQQISSAASATKTDVGRESVIGNENREASPPSERFSRATTVPFSPERLNVRGKQPKIKNLLTRQKALSEIYLKTSPKPIFKSRAGISLGNKQTSRVKGKEKAVEALTRQKKKIKSSKQIPEETGLTDLKGKGKVSEDLTGKKGTKTRANKRESPPKGVPSKVTRRLRQSISAVDMRRLFYARYDNAVWGWIYGGATYSMAEWHQEWKYNQQPKIANFAAELASEIEKINHQGERSRVDATSNIKLNALNFANLLFLINLRLIQSFKTLPNIEYYIEEHGRLQEWLLEEERSRLADSATITRSEIAFPELPLEQVVSNVNEVLCCKESDKLVKRVTKTRTDGETTFIGVISDSQLKMTKAIVPLLAYYYKSSNVKKWNLLFQHEGYYLAHLSKLQTPAYNCVPVLIDAQKPYIDVLNLLPWRNSLGVVEDLVKAGLRSAMRGSLSNKMYNWIEPFAIGSPADVDDKLWATLTLLKERNAEELETDSEPLIIAQNQFDSKINKSLSPSLKQFLSTEINLEGVESLVSTLWEFNARLLEAFGYHPGDTEYLEEQKDIQNELFEILNKPRSQEAEEPVPN